MTDTQASPEPRRSPPTPASAAPQGNRVKLSADGYATFLSAAPVAVYRLALDKAGAIVFLACEGGLADEKSISTSSVARRTLDEALPPDVVRLLRPEVERAFAGQEATAEVTWDGRVLRNELEPITRDDGSVEAVQGVMTDVTEAERAVEGLRVFASAVSHDLRAPLAVARNETSILRRRYADKLDKDGRAHMARIDGALSRMSGLMEDLLSLTEASRGDLEVAEIEIGTMAAETAAMLHESEPTRGVPLHVDELATGHGDERLVRILLENLFAHAWKGTRRLAGAEVSFTAQPGEDNTVFCLTVSGKGIDVSDAARLFRGEEAFHDPSEMGAVGVSLAIIDTIVRRHGGRFWTSAAEGGAAFCFTLAPAWYAYV